MEQVKLANKLMEGEKEFNKSLPCKEITMTAEQAKIYISKYVIPQCNKGNEAILRELIFSLSNVDWSKAGNIIIHEHPELIQERIDRDLISK